MSIAKRVVEAIDDLVAGDFEASLIPASIAVDATASQVYPTKSNNEAYKDWLHDNLGFITFVGMGKVSITNQFRFQYNHPNIRTDDEGFCSLEQILYHIVRCGLVHSARLPETLKFGPAGRTYWEGDTLVLSSGLISGLLAAVIVSPVNAGLTAPERYGVAVAGQTRPLNDLWGNKQAYIDFLNGA